MDAPIGTDSDFRQRIWTELLAAQHDRHHEWRTPVLASTGVNGVPDARTVVLRVANAHKTELQFFTDRRSPKVEALRQRPEACLVFWSKSLGWQLRAYVQVSVVTHGPAIETAWERIQQTAAAGDYLADHAPGTPLPQALTNAIDVDTPEGHQLAILVAKIRSCDWLELSRDGHRRAMFDDQKWEWCVP